MALHRMWVDEVGSQDAAGTAIQKPRTVKIAANEQIVEEEIIIDGLPDYLRDDAPFQTCNRCERKTWAQSEFGQLDTMTQPDGKACGGRFK